MNPPWQKARLGEVLKRSEESIHIEPDTSYREITVKLWGKGVVQRGVVMGVEVAAQRRYVARAGQFILSRIDARNGALGVVPRELDGAIVSSDFPLFDVDLDRLLPAFLGWMCRTAPFVEACQRASEGTTNRVRIQEDQLLATEIPLPPLAEQRRVTAWIDTLAIHSSEARRLRQGAVKELEALSSVAHSDACTGGATRSWRDQRPEVESARDLLSRIAKARWPGHAASRRRDPINLPPPPSIPSSWQAVEAGELQERGAILDIQDGNHGSDYPRKAEFGEEGIPFVTAKQIEGGTVRIAAAPRLSRERAARLRIGFARAGDVLLTHNASVGDVAMAAPEPAEFLLGTSVTYWRCNPEALEPRYLFHFMRSEYFQHQLRFIMKQTTRNQVSVLKQVSLWICVPPLAEQRMIVASLDALAVEVNSLKRRQTETAGELEALVPAILGRALQGNV